MPIDLMSPVQALESATMKLVAKKESEKHLEIAKQNADSNKMKAEAYKQSVDKQLSAEDKVAISNNERLKANARAREQRYKYLINSSEMAQRAKDSLSEEQDTIRKNQVKLGGE